MDENARFSGEDRSWKNDSGRKEASDSEMLRTYSTGLLALCLAGYAPVVDGQFLSSSDFFVLVNFLVNIYIIFD